MELSEDDYKLIYSQRYGIPPPMHLMRISWPLMTRVQKFLVFAYVSICIGIIMLFLFGGTLEWLLLQ